MQKNGGISHLRLHLGKKIERNRCTMNIFWDLVSKDALVREESAIKLVSLLKGVSFGVCKQSWLTLCQMTEWQRTQPAPRTPRNA
jgi:hypothetical protein